MADAGDGRDGDSATTERCRRGDVLTGMAEEVAVSAATPAPLATVFWVVHHGGRG